MHSRRPAFAPARAGLVSGRPDGMRPAGRRLGQHASPDPAWHRGRELIATLLSSDDLPDGLRKPLLELTARLGPA